MWKKTWLYVNSERVIGKKLLKEDFRRKKEVEVFFIEKNILLDLMFLKSCGKKDKNNLEKEPYSDLKAYADFMESREIEICLE